MVMLCDQCPHTDFFLVEEWESERTCLHECAFCPTLAKIDAEILKIHDILVKLSKKRNALKIKINRHHNPPINRLPFELISQIFIDVVKEEPPETFWDYSIPTRLGGVCKAWRNITLGTPQLWTSVRMKVKACKSPSEIDVAKEWLSRSHSLPLSLNLDFLDCSGVCAPNNPFTHLFPPIDLIKSHSTRWSRLDIKSSTSILIHQLLNNLQDRPADLEYLSVGPSRDGTSLTYYPEPTLHPRSISQTGSRFLNVGLWNLPCGFERVTRMEMNTVPIDQVCQFFKVAPNLQECEVISYEHDEAVFALPTLPIVAKHLTALKANFSTFAPPFFTHLTLPSLRTLDLEYLLVSSRDILVDLVACLERSSPPLQKFHLALHIDYATVDDWYELLPSVTSLTLDLSSMLESRPSIQSMVAEELLAALARRSGTLVFPKLTSLHIIAKGMSGASWSSLCDIFRMVSREQARSRKLLKNIEIHITDEWERHYSMEARVFEFFEDLRSSGIQLKVSIDKGPKFGTSASMFQIP